MKPAPFALLLLVFCSAAQLIAVSDAWGIQSVRTQPRPANISGAFDPEADIVASLLEQLAIAKQQNGQLRENLLRAKYHQPILVSTRFDGKAYGWQACSAMLGAVLLAAVLWMEGSKRQLKRGWSDRVDVLAVMAQRWRDQRSGQAPAASSAGAAGPTGSPLRR
jgi:hypothetical protein